MRQAQSRFRRGRGHGSGLAEFLVASPGLGIVSLPAPGNPWLQGSRPGQALKPHEGSSATGQARLQGKSIPSGTQSRSPPGADVPTQPLAKLSRSDRLCAQVPGNRHAPGRKGEPSSAQTSRDPPPPPGNQLGPEHRQPRVSTTDRSSPLPLLPGAGRQHPRKPPPQPQRKQRTGKGSNSPGLATGGPFPAGEAQQGWEEVGVEQRSSRSSRARPTHLLQGFTSGPRTQPPKGTPSLGTSGV